MTEIALCIAVIGIALVAIIGVLPSGLTVQKQNREDTLVAQDSQFLTESIRSGSIGISDLTNRVDFIHWRRMSATPAEQGDEYYRGPNFTDALPGTSIPITDAWQILALLSVPRFESKLVGRNVVLIENEITAQFRSLNSPFTEKSYRDGAGNLPDPTRFTTALRYLVNVEAVSAVTRPTPTTNAFPNPVDYAVAFNQQLQLDQSLSDLRLTFQWPVYRVGTEFRVGGSRRTFRTQVFGNRQILTTNFMGTGRIVSRFNGSPAVTNLLQRF